MPKFRKPGYTQIPNEIFDELMPTLTGAQFKILCLIARRTLGYHRDCYAMTIPDISEGSGLSNDGVSDALKGMEPFEYVIRERMYHGEGRKEAGSVYRLNIEGDEDGDLQYRKNSGINETSIPEKLRGPIPEKLLPLNKEDKEKILKEKIYNEEFASLTENQNPTPLPGELGCPTLDAVVVDDSAPVSERPGIDPAELCLEDPIEVFAKNAYRRRPGAKLENLHTQRNVRIGGLVPRLEENEQEMGPADFRTALLSYLKSEDDWRRKNAWPIQGFLKNPSKWLPNQPPPIRRINATPVNSPATQSVDSGTIQIPPQDAPAPPKRKSEIYFEELWKVYPARRRTMKLEALEEYQKQIRSLEEHQAMMERVEEFWIPSKDWAEGKFTVGIKKWIINRCWEEEPEPAEAPYNDGYINVRDLKPRRHNTREEEIAERKRYGVSLPVPEDWDVGYEPEK